MSPTFSRPPVDKSLSIPELYDWHYSHNRDYPLFVFENANDSVRTITMGEGVQGMHRATRYVRERVDLELIPGLTPIGKPPVIAILASSDTITFFCTIIGALRTGWTVFPISTRNSPRAVAALLSETKALHLLVSAEVSVQGLADSSIKLVDNDTMKFQKIDMPVFRDLFPVQGFDSKFKTVSSARLDMDTAAVIYHSSGIVAFLGLRNYFVPQTHILDTPSFILDNPANLYATVGVTMAFFKPHFPAIVPNPVNVFVGALLTKADYIFAPPSFLEAWSRNPAYVDAMSKINGVIYGGAPLDKSAGDLLSSKGVNVFLTYASTQTGGVSEILPKPPGKDWEYFRFSSNRVVHFEDNGNNEFEVVVIATDSYRPNVINNQVNGRDAFATSDLVTPHPTKPGYYRLVGRVDDQIMHSTESMLNQNALVEAALFFGRGRFQCGVLIQPSQPYAFDPSDSSKLIEFRNAIWPSIEELNAFAPTHSRIFKEATKPFMYTAKATLRRQHVINEYAPEIEALYEAVAESTQEDIDRPEDWSQSSASRFVRGIMERTMKTDVNAIGDNVDLFQHGLDSLQATWVRNTVLRALSESHTNVARGLSTSFVYDHPTIASLASYISSNVAGTVVAGQDKNVKKSELLALVDKYTSAFPAFKTGIAQAHSGDVVVLTGGTGSLGSNILAKLIQSSSTVRVYALSRPSSDGSVKERLAKTFERENLELKLLDDTKLRLLEGDASKPDFGIGAERFTELQSSVTHIIHNAWRVNFNNAVTSFETNIRSVRSLIDFLLGGHGAKPACFLFISSIGVFQNYDGDKLALEEAFESPDSALGSGYGESKWVSEQILQIAAKETPLKSTVVRPGQLTGGPSGSWNTHEWFPSLVKSSVALKKIPGAEGTVSWLSANIAAGAIVEMLHSEESVLHLVHPRPVEWTSIITEFSKKLNLPVVSYGEWLAALEHSRSVIGSGDNNQLEDAFRQNPALRFLKFFRSAKDRVGENIEPLKVARLACIKSCKVSEVLRDAEEMGAEDVNRWIYHWKESEYLGQ
ncbi:acetyl-CoA synthetase-like protein [Phellopilus nigrolimitatus]|nr:acetyl-CoA synthetase-like protein [Phellopilus nigrolimitatus]